MSDDEYPIFTENGKQFCRCRKEGGQVLLVTKNCTMPLDELTKQAVCPEIYQKSRGKRNSRLYMRASDL